MNTPVKKYPTVKAHIERPALQKTSQPPHAVGSHQLGLEAGLDDAGFVKTDRPPLMTILPALYAIWFRVSYVDAVRCNHGKQARL